jgi:hypothetical protein
MSETCKSPRTVLVTAWKVATAVLPLYSHRFSPKKSTQHQLFACLVLKPLLKTDYRGLAGANALQQETLRATLASGNGSQYDKASIGLRGKRQKLLVAASRPHVVGHHTQHNDPLTFRHHSANQGFLRSSSAPS